MEDLNRITLSYVRISLYYLPTVHLEWEPLHFGWMNSNQRAVNSK